MGRQVLIFEELGSSRALRGSLYPVAYAQSIKHMHLGRGTVVPSCGHTRGPGQDTKGFSKGDEMSQFLKVCNALNLS